MFNGKILKEKRIKLKITQIELSTKLKISRNYLSDIENNRKKPSKELEEKIIYFLERKNNNTKREKRYSKEELKKMELEIIETYDFIRDEKNVFSKIASIQKELIRLNKTLEEIFLKIDFLYDEDNNFLKDKIKRPLLTTIKNLTLKREKLENLVNSIIIEKNEQKEKKMDISNLISEIPLSKFTREQKRTAILVWVAMNIKIRLKYYNFDKNMPSGYSTRLWAVGRKGTTKTKMENIIDNNIAMNIGAANNDEEVIEIMEEISEGILENAMIVTEDFLRAARNAKTLEVRNRYLEASNNPEYLKVAFIISTLYYAKKLQEIGQSLNHKNLEIRLQSLDENKKKLDAIWKEYGRGNISYEEAAEKTNSILEIYETQITLSNTETEELLKEKMIYTLMGENNLNLLIEKIVNDIRENVIGQLNLFRNEDITL